MRTLQISSQRKWIILFVCTSAFFMTYFSRVSWSIISPYSSLHSTLAQDSFIFSVFFVGYVAVQIPAGIVSDRRPTLVITMISLVGIAGGALIGGLANQLWIEYLSSFVMGSSAGWIYPSTLRIIVNTFVGGRALSAATGFYSASLPLALTTTGGLLPALVLLINWRWGLVIITVICGILAILAAFVRETKQSQNNMDKIKDRDEYRFSARSFLNKNVVMIGVAGFFFFISYWYTNLYAYSYFLSIHMGPYQAGVAYSLLSAPGIFSSPILGVITNRAGIKQTTIGSIFFSAIFLFSLPTTHTVVLIGVLAVVIGFLRFLANAAVTNLVAVVGGTRTGSTAGLSNVFWQTSGIIAPLIAAFLIGQFGYFLSWWMMAVAAFVSAVLFILVQVNPVTATPTQ